MLRIGTVSFVMTCHPPARRSPTSRSRSTRRAPRAARSRAEARSRRAPGRPGRSVGASRTSAPITCGSSAAPTSGSDEAARLEHPPEGEHERGARARRARRRPGAGAVPSLVVARGAVRVPGRSRSRSDASTTGSTDATGWRALAGGDHGDAGIADAGSSTRRRGRRRDSRSPRRPHRSRAGPRRPRHHAARGGRVRPTSTTASRSRRSSTAPGPGRPSTSPRVVSTSTGAWAAPQAHGQRRDRLDRDLERTPRRAPRAACRGRARRDPGDAASSWRTTQLAGAGARAPVDPARVVARLVVAQREELAERLDARVPGHLRRGPPGSPPPPRRGATHARGPAGRRPRRSPRPPRTLRRTSPNGSVTTPTSGPTT